MWNSNLVVDKTFVSLGGFDDYINPSYDKVLSLENVLWLSI